MNWLLIALVFVVLLFLIASTLLYWAEVWTRGQTRVNQRVRRL